LDVLEEKENAWIAYQLNQEEYLKINNLSKPPS
jgi:hypothetical protein